MPNAELEVTRKEGVTAGVAIAAAAIVGGLAWWSLQEKDEDPPPGEFGPLDTRDETFNFLGPDPLCESVEGRYDGNITGDVKGTGWFVGRFWHMGPGTPTVIATDPIFIDQDWGPFIVNIGFFIIPPFLFPVGSNVEWLLELVESDETGFPLVTLSQGETTSGIAAC